MESEDDDRLRMLNLHAFVDHDYNSASDANLSATDEGDGLLASGLISHVPSGGSGELYDTTTNVVTATAASIYSRPIPRALLRNLDLESLTVSVGRLRSIPPAVGRLINLTELDVHGNALSGTRWCVPLPCAAGVAWFLV